MDNDNNGEHTTTRGADWEVVQLTASTYAAAPGPREVGLTDETKDTEKIAAYEPPRGLYMSDHFVFPPSEHENLPIEPEVTEIDDEYARLGTDWIDDSAFQHDNKRKSSAAYRSDAYRLELSEEQDDAGYMIYTQSKNVQRLNLDDDNKDEIPESLAKYLKHGEEKNVEGSNLPCEAWWKKHASSMYHRAKEGSTLWSIVLAATVVGLVIWGHRWHRGKMTFPSK